MILITGATGKIGGAVIQQLLTKMPAANIAALVRDPAKAADLQAKGISIRVGEYDNTESLYAAMQGVEKALLVSGGGAQNGLQQHQNVVDAAVKAGVKCIAYTGRSLKDRSTLANNLMTRHFDTEDYIKESGLSYVLFRNILYMDVLPLYVDGPKVFDTGIHLPAGEGKVSYALRSEMGEAIANVLAEEDCSNKTYDFTGSELYSMFDVATALTALSGKSVTYTDIKAGQESTVSNDLEMKLRRKPSVLQEGLKMLFQL